MELNYDILNIVMNIVETGNYCIFIDIDDMQIFLCSKEKEKYLYPLYVNEEDVGPSEREIGNEFFKSLNSPLSD